MQYVVIAVVAVVALAVILYPILRPAPRPIRRPAADVSDAALDAEVDRYRAALRAGTLCLACGYANAESSRFCAECGGPLLTARAVETGDALAD